MIIAIANQKGGVAKTTSTIALAGLLAEVCSCLAVDFDPQGHLSLGLGVRVQKGQSTAYHVLTDETVRAKETIVDTQCGVKLIPADIALAKGEKESLGEIGNTGLLKRKLAPLKKEYDHIVIDCPPSLGLLTINALAAADLVLVPVQCQFFGLDGLWKFIETVKGVRSREVNPHLQILGILPTMADNTNTTQDGLNTLKEKLKGIRIFEPVPKSVKFPESNLARKPIHAYTKEQKLVAPYKAIVKQIVG